MAPRPGDKFLIHVALCQWNNNCSGSVNNEILVGPHPLFPDETPIATVFPGQDIVQAEGTRSWTCYSMELDIKPAGCPNPLNVKLFDWYLDSSPKPPVFPTAILGSETVDVYDIDVSTILLEGVPPLRHAYEDVATPDGRVDCACNDFDGDGYMDLTLKFDRVEIARHPEWWRAPGRASTRVDGDRPAQRRHAVPGERLHHSGRRRQFEARG
jgi:hypothetical protein